MSESNATREGGLWESLLSSAISQFADPAPIRFTDRDFARGRTLVTKCRQEAGENLHFRTALPRNAFLAACLKLTAEESREHLLAGFGIQRGSSTFVARVAHRLGSTNSVCFPPELQAEIVTYVQSGHRNEVLVFHNHPANPINALCDNEPWASPQDRRVAMTHAAAPAMFIKALTNGGRTRFYVGENGYVRQFIGPDVFTVLKNLNLG